METFISEEMLEEGTISRSDLEQLYLCDKPEATVEHILSTLPQQ